MISIKVLLTKILQRITPKLISATRVTAPSTQLEPATVSVNLDGYDTILVRAGVNNITQFLTFTRLSGSTIQSLSEYYGGEYFRGFVFVDWENNEVSVEYANCPSGKNSYIWIQQIYAIG